jgi:hypothetical protein
MKPRLAAWLIACAAAASALGAHPAHATGVLPGSAGAARPVLAVDPYGTAYVAATDATGATLLWKVADGSASALAPGGLLAQLPGGAAAALATDAAADVHVAQTGSVVTVRRSIDGGATWDRGTPLASALADSASMAAAKFNSIVEGATLVLVSAIDGNLVAARSDDGGLTFARASVVDPSCRRACELGNVVVDETGNEVAVAYLRNGGVELARSADGGVTFDVADIASNATEAPSLARAHDGTLLLAWCAPHGVALARARGSNPIPAAFLFDADAPSGAHVAADSGGGAAIVFDDAGAVSLLRSRDGTTFARSILATQSHADLALAPNPQGGFVAVAGAPDGIRVLPISP